MTDYYFAAPTAQALIDALAPPEVAPRFRFQATFFNVMEPKQGQAAVAEHEEGGVLIPAEPARGDPAKWYVCIRSGEAVVAPQGVELVSEDEGRAVCGVWA